MKKISFLIMAVFVFGFSATSQSRLVFSGGKMVLQNGAYLVLDNSAANAITSSNSTGGITTDAASLIRWNIGISAGFYSVPYFFSNTLIPFGFSTTGAVGAGYFNLNSYNVPTWKNSDYLPAGVTNVNNSAGVDNSSQLVDRFWSISAAGYTTKPTLDDVSFGYRDDEWTSAGNTILESRLKAQRWNSGLMTWNDYVASGSANVTDNTVIVPDIAPDDLFQWWTLVDVIQGPLPIQLLFFNAQAINNNVIYTKWKTSSESNSSHFILERSQTAISFFPVNTIPAAGNSSTERTYESIDPSPFAGRSFYRLKMVDRDGSFKYSSVVPVLINGKDETSVYPNPVVSNLFIDIQRAGSKTILLFNEKGQAVLFRTPVHGINELDLKSVPAGVYWLKINFDKESEVFKIIKQ